MIKGGLVGNYDPQNGMSHKNLSIILPK